MSLQMLSMLSWLLPHSAAVRMLRCDAICPTRTTLLKELRQKKHQRTSCVQRMLQEREEFRGRLRQWQPMWARNSPTCAGKRWKKPSLSECPFVRRTACDLWDLFVRAARRQVERKSELGQGPAPPPAPLSSWRPLLLKAPSPPAICRCMPAPPPCRSARSRARLPPLRSAPLRSVDRLRLRLLLGVLSLSERRHAEASVAFPAACCSYLRLLGSPQV